MRRLIKRMAAALLAGACLLGLSACSMQESQPAAYEAAGISTDGTPVDASMAQAMILSAAQTLGGSKEQLIVSRDMARSQGDEGTASVYEKQLAARSELGELRSVDLEDAAVYMLADGSYTVVLPVTFTKGQMNYLMNLNMATQEIQAGFASEAAGNVNSSVVQQTETGVVYTIVGMGTVFAVLIFISLIIYCFRFINVIGTKKAPEAGSAPAAPAPAAPVPAPAAPVPAPAAPVPAADDEAEIAAVIAAAIAAAEADLAAESGKAPAALLSNGLVVRSIRRLPKNGRR